jgi:hypothetical protein
VCNQAHTIRAAERYGANQEQLDIWEYKAHSFRMPERAALDFALVASNSNGVDEKPKPAINILE